MNDGMSRNNPGGSRCELTIHHGSNPASFTPGKVHPEQLPGAASQVSQYTGPPSKCKACRVAVVRACPPARTQRKHLHEEWSV